MVDQPQEIPVVAAPSVLPDAEPGSLEAIARAYLAKFGFGGRGAIGLKQVDGQQSNQDLSATYRPPPAAPPALPLEKWTAHPARQGIKGGPKR